MAAGGNGDNDTDWGKFLSIGLEMGVGAVLGLAVGLWLDKKFGWNPWGVLCGAFLGLAGGMYSLIKEGIRANKD